jgi:hypothetical protein
MSEDDLVENLAAKFLDAARDHSPGVVFKALGYAARLIADDMNVPLKEALETIVEEACSAEYEEGERLQ